MTTAYAVFTNKDYAKQLSYFVIVLGIGMVEATIWYTNRLGHGISHVIGYIGANTLSIYLFHPIPRYCRGGDGYACCQYVARPYGVKVFIPFAGTVTIPRMRHIFIFIEKMCGLFCYFVTKQWPARYIYR